MSALLAVVLVALGATGCGGGGGSGGNGAANAVSSNNADGGDNSQSGAVKQGGTLRMAIGSDVIDFDPYSRALQQYVFTKVIYEPLVEYDDAMKPQPVLASSWKIAKNLEKVTVAIKPGVTFHDGGKLDAAAVVANFKRAQNPDTGQHMTFFVEPVKTAKATGPMEVTLQLKRPTPEPVITDMLQSLPIVDPAVFDKLKREASGTGPYKLAKWTPGTSIELVRNPDWHGEPGGPHLDKVVMQIFSDPSAEVSALRSNSVDVIDGVSPDQAKSLEGDGFSIVKGAPGSLTMELRLNPKRPPFASAAYRQAIGAAIDRKTIVDSVLAGFGEPIITPLFTHYSTDERSSLASQYGYSLDRAKSLLQKAGGPGQGFSIMLASSNPTSIQAAQVVQAGLRDIGVSVKLEQVEPTTYTDRLVKGDFDATLTVGSGGQHYPSQLTFGSAWRPVANALWGDNVPQDYVKAIEASQAALTPQDQAATLDRLTRAILQMGTVVEIADQPTLFAVAPQVHGLSLTVDSMPLLGKAGLAG